MVCFAAGLKDIFHLLIDIPRNVFFFFFSSCNRKADRPERNLRRRAVALGESGKEGDVGVDSDWRLDIVSGFSIDRK